MAMFQAPARPAGNVHTEFKAGKMDWDGKVVKADKRKGRIVLYTADEDQLMHFQWYDREKNEAQLDLIFFNDAYLSEVKKCTTGRVYLLRFTSSDKKHFFWMQEPKADGDEELIKKFNEAIGATIPDKKAAGRSTGTTAAAPPTAAAAAGAEVDPQLRAILSQFLETQGAANLRTPPVPLGAVLTTEVLSGLLTDETACKELTSLLPPGQQTQEDLAEALRSPQLQQHMNSLTQAIHSDQLPMLFAALGLDPSTIASAGPGADALEVLCRAMEAKESGSMP